MSDPPQDQQLTISNVRSGLVCGALGIRRVCFQTEDVPLTGEGDCVYAGRAMKCTWYGFSFDYRLSSGTAQLVCTWTDTAPVNMGNPMGVTDAHATTGAVTLSLSSTDRHFFNPEYTVFRDGHRSGTSDTITDSCAFNGKVLFVVTYRIHEPDAP